MFPYRFDVAQPVEPAPQPQPAPDRGRVRRLRSAALLGLALTSGAVGGGAVGSVAATRWLVPEQANAVLVTPQLAGAQPAPGNVAGAVFAKVNPAVVQVLASHEAGGELTPFGSGSGFVVDARGLILTNNHVIDEAGAVTVRFSNGEEREARVLGTDRGNDVALLKVDLPPDVPVSELGDSDTAQVGETAIAIGSPFGLDQTVTQGIVSAVHRDWYAGTGRLQRNLIQTDAPINPGNSGGPLLNARGQVIGINTMIESPVRGSVGVGFAVPINTAKRLLGPLEAGAHLEPVWLGISGREVDAEIARDQGLVVEQGVMVASVAPNSPAEEAGLRGATNADAAVPSGGDVITAVDGEPVKNVRELTDRLAGLMPGDTVRLNVLRDGEEQTVDVTLQAWPKETA